MTLGAEPGRHAGAHGDVGFPCADPMGANDIKSRVRVKCNELITA